LPIYEAEVEGTEIYILPMRGAGLWGPIWGYLAVEADGSTIYGSEFGHAGETPGLGAEIVEPAFRNQFTGKELFKEGDFRSIAVVKPGKSVTNRDYVDGISGGTITSQGVDKMLLQSVGEYKSFLMNLQAAQ
jgi:Na+-transporting NADH:ubiquinone oxidoreductase subunit C